MLDTILHPKTAYPCEMGRKINRFSGQKRMKCVSFSVKMALKFENILADFIWVISLKPTLLWHFNVVLEVSELSWAFGFCCRPPPAKVMTCVQVVNMGNAIKLNIHVRVQGLSANGSGKKGKSELKYRKRGQEHKNSLSGMVKLSTYLVGIHLARIWRICH